MGFSVLFLTDVLRLELFFLANPNVSIRIYFSWWNKKRIKNLSSENSFMFSYLCCTYLSLKFQFADFESSNLTYI